MLGTNTATLYRLSKVHPHLCDTNIAPLNQHCWRSGVTQCLPRRSCHNSHYISDAQKNAFIRYLFYVHYFLPFFWNQINISEHYAITALILLWHVCKVRTGTYDSLQPVHKLCYSTSKWYVQAKCSLISCTTFMFSSNSYCSNLHVTKDAEMNIYARCQHFVLVCGMVMHLKEDMITYMNNALWIHAFENGMLTKMCIDSLCHKKSIHTCIIFVQLLPVVFTEYGMYRILPAKEQYLNMLSTRCTFLQN